MLSSPPDFSGELSDLEVIEVVSGSRVFAREFLEHEKFGSAGALAGIRSPRDLLVLPSCKPAIVSRVVCGYEWAARIAEFVGA